MSFWIYLPFLEHEHWLKKQSEHQMNSKIALKNCSKCLLYFITKQIWIFYGTKLARERCLKLLYGILCKLLFCPEFSFFHNKHSMNTFLVTRFFFARNVFIPSLRLFSTIIFRLGLFFFSCVVVCCASELWISSTYTICPLCNSDYLKLLIYEIWICRTNHSLAISPTPFRSYHLLFFCLFFSFLNQYSISQSYYIYTHM